VGMLAKVVNQQHAGRPTTARTTSEMTGTIGTSWLSTAAGPPDSRKVSHS